jgi:hypothetical protein
MRFSAFATVTLLLALSLLTRAATFAQRNLPVFGNESASTLTISTQTVTDSEGGGLIPTHPSVRRTALLRNICFADPLSIPAIIPEVSKFLAPPSRVLISAQINHPVRPPAC